jgi:hypothetical protein
VLESTRLFISSLVPSGVRIEQVSFDETLFQLPLGAEAEYRFTVFIWGEEAQLSAVRVGAPPNEYFWYRPFEDVAFRGGPSALESALHQQIRAVVTAPAT